VRFLVGAKQGKKPRMAQGTGAAGQGQAEAQDTGFPLDFDSWPQERRDQHWIEHVYKPDEPQLTMRAVLTGMVLGGVLAIANMYIALKIGWSMGMAITSTILAFATFKMLQTMGLVKTELTMLENNTVASAASAAGYYSSAGMTSAIPALYLTTGQSLSWWQLGLWMSAVSFVGVLMAVPMRRQMIDVERLTFPSGTACATTIRSMHQSAVEAMAKARALFWAGLVAFLWEFPVQVTHFFSVKNFTHVGGHLTFAWTGLKIGGKAIWAYGLGLPTSLLMYGAGAIMGIRVGLSMGLGAILLYGVLTPIMARHGVIVVSDEGPQTYRSVLAWAVWPGVMTALMGSLLHFALKWRAVVGAFGMLGKIAKTKPSPMAAVEVPGSWFGWGMAASTLLVMVSGRTIFGIPMWMGFVATALSFVLAIVACRATGETDVTPIGALGKITQLTFAAIRPGHYATNLMTATVTAGSASHSADLLTDLKTGYLLGGAPRRQFIAQFMGIIAGGLFCVVGYKLVVRNPDLLGTSKLPAPSAFTWAVVADLLSHGIETKDRGDGAAVATEVQVVSLGVKPAGTAAGDTLRIVEGPNAGDYKIVATERRLLFLDRDWPVAIADASDEPKPVAAMVLTPTGEARHQGTVPLKPNAIARPGLRFTAMPLGAMSHDYVRVDQQGNDVWHQIKGLRGDVAWLDHGFAATSAEAPTSVFVKKSTLPPYAMTATIIGLIIGLIITLLEAFGPAKLKAYLPSVTGLGIAFVVNCFDSLAMMIGAILAYVLLKTAPKIEERYNVAASSGIIAGASIAGLLLIAFSQIVEIFRIE
jgi:uncharacterized oligopeptide transporter (OPT) family protein